MNKHQLACLYTKHKTQKRKVWKDGRLVLTSHRAVLYDACCNRIGSSCDDPALDSCEVSPGEQQSILQRPNGQTLETEKFLIEVEGPWLTMTMTTPTSVQSSGKDLASSSTSSLSKTISSSMQKLLKSKFQKPKTFVPPPPGTQPTRRSTILGKRLRQPLQRENWSECTMGWTNTGTIRMDL
jgi:hypothetical protein